MTFEDFCRIIDEHGIGEFRFLYNNTECNIQTVLSEYDLYYTVYNGEAQYSFNDSDELIYGKCFDGKNLCDIWEEIEIITIDGIKEASYNVKNHSFDFVSKLREQERLLWSYTLNKKESFLLQMKYILFGALLLPIASIIFPILGLSDWSLLILTFTCSILVLAITSISFRKNNNNIKYQITTEKIIIYYGLPISTTYKNIKKVKLKKSIWNKDVGTVKLYLKKGLSLNFRLAYVKEPQKIYNLILDNMNV